MKNDGKQMNCPGGSPFVTRPSTLDSRLRRRTRLVLLLFAPFLASVFGAWAWFNTNLGAGRSTLDAGQHPRLWLVARTNIPGYVFIAEHVSDEVKKTLGTTNILSETFYKIAESEHKSDGLNKSEIILA